MGGDRRSSRVRLLPDYFGGDPCKFSLIDPKRRPLSALTLARFSSRWTQSIDLAGYIVVTGRRRKMSKHTVRSGDIAGLRTRFSQLKDKVQIRMGQVVPIIVIQEAGLDGFWIHRLLQDEGVESHVVDPASIATSRRRRRAKTDKIEGSSGASFASV